jgi:hypothetical protein
MFAIIVVPASCEVCAVIRFLCAKESSTSEIHRELWLVYGPTVMNEGKVRQWGRDFINGRKNIHDEEWSGRGPAGKLMKSFLWWTKNCDLIVG